MAAAASLVGLGATFAYLTMRMTDGWRVVERSSDQLLTIYFTVIFAATAVGILAGIIARGEGDERDRAIASSANLNERIFFLIAVNALLWQAMWEGMFASAALPRPDLRSPPVLFFALFAMLFLGEFVRLVSIIALYRRQGANG